jgi:zinc/manganese transport system ATP-binding protein
MTTDVLSELYDSHVEVIHANGRIVVVGLPDATTHHHDEAHAAAAEGA